MTADYDKVYARTHQINDIVKNARTITVTNSNNTDMVVTLCPERLGWVASDGRITRHGFPMNVPNGEVYGVPKSVDGIYTTTLLGDKFTAKYGPLYDRPVTMELEKGYVMNVVCSDKQLQKVFFDYVEKGRNTDRVGEFAIGTNENITYLIGYMLADEKAVGVHMALGRPFKKSFKKGTPWKVKPDQHCDAIQQGSTVLVDGLMIMKEGKFII
jgi:aminopeptidase